MTLKATSRQIYIKVAGTTARKERDRRYRRRFRCAREPLPFSVSLSLFFVFFVFRAFSMAERID